MKPTYCNNAAATINNTTKDVSLTFTHMYLEHQLSVTPDGGLTDVTAQIVDEVGSVVMSMESFSNYVKVITGLWEMIQDNWGAQNE